RAYAPALREELCIRETVCEPENGVYVLPRFADGRDGLFLRYECMQNGEILPGKCYAEVLDFPRVYEDDYPTAGTIKGLQVTDVEDAIALGVKHAAHNVAITDLMRAEPTENTITFPFDGVDYYFDKTRLEYHDRTISELSSHGILVTLILLCSKHWNTETPENMYRALLHPDFIPNMNDPDVHLSAFNMTTDEGIRHYMAFIAFLTTHYSGKHPEYGKAVGYIISNEVNSQWVWGNAGNMPVEAYTKEYTTALRLAWQVSASLSKSHRIYVSLDHFWTGALSGDKMKYYGSRDVLTLINRYAKAEGEVGWNVAFHPYPEDLNFPDFWNDKTASEDFDTYRITFKNLKVLARFLEQEEFLCFGVRRRIILSEQGFNSHWTPESEILQACAYGRAYRTCMEIPEIDSFILHAHRDNAGEFGLNLGILRRKRENNEIDGPKPIYYVFKAIDQKDESGKYHWERY
ncbi:MAG: DUF5722 domain-containing protein, partial [Clostridia bacterium]|nr:DUF5722 domain-containing protein [Clostridia bacterium]